MNIKKEKWPNSIINVPDRIENAFCNAFYSEKFEV